MADSPGTSSRYDGPIVDAHQHFWDPRHNLHPWLEPDVLKPFRYGDYSALKRPYLPGDYREDSKGFDVRHTVYVEAEWDPTEPVGETQYVSDLAGEHGLPSAIVAQAWLDRADVTDVLAAQAEFPLVRGVRHKPAGPASPRERATGRRTAMCDERWRAGYALLEDHALSFDLQTGWWNLADAYDLATAFPGIQVVVDHAALPSDRTRDGLRRWRDALEEVAAAPNVALKVSGIADPAHPWTVDRNATVVDQAIEVFGTDRVMFASNFPVDGLCATFAEIYDGFRTMTSGLAPASQHALFYGNAMRIYRIAGTTPGSGGRAPRPRR
jgi:predicted TIM-barrel fold metal-dependent hydrolase